MKVTLYVENTNPFLVRKFETRELLVSPYYVFNTANSAVEVFKHFVGYIPFEKYFTLEEKDSLRR